MATEKRVTFDDHGEPVVVITIRGWDDAFRFAWAMGHLQCEFADLARRIGGSLQRRLGAKRFKEFHQRFTSGPVAWVRHDGTDDALQTAYDLLVFADGLAVSHAGMGLADLYAEDYRPAQDTLAAAGCWPRGTFTSQPSDPSESATPDEPSTSTVGPVGPY